MKSNKHIIRNLEQILKGSLSLEEGKEIISELHETDDILSELEYIEEFINDENSIRLEIERIIEDIEQTNNTNRKPTKQDLDEIVNDMNKQKLDELNRVLNLMKTHK